MKILVTGHRGFIGSHVYEHLTELGFDVDGYDIPYDIGDFKTNKKYDVVIHLAANAAIREAIKDPDAFWENNVVKSKPIFDYCRENDVRCLYASMRFFNVYAPKVSRSDMLYRMLETKTATYLTRHKRDWIHVDDVVYAIATLMPSTYTGVIDVGTGNPVAVIDLAMKMGMGHLPIKEETPGERDITCADTTELRKLGWMPTINILDTV